MLLGVWGGLVVRWFAVVFPVVCRYGAGMANRIDLRGVPDEVVEWWRLEAEVAGRSLNQHLIRILVSQFEKAHRSKSVVSRGK